MMVNIDNSMRSGYGEDKHLGTPFRNYLELIDVGRSTIAVGVPIPG